MENQRREMVALVNAFYTACGLETRCQENSHIALDECLDDVWPRAEALWAGYRAMLDGLGERGV